MLQSVIFQKHLCCPPTPSTSSSVSLSLRDVVHPHFNVCLHKRRLPVPEAAVQSLLLGEAIPFRVRVRLESLWILR